MTTPQSATKPRLVLASASPRRSELLSEAGIEFDIAASDVPEPDRDPGEPCGEYAMRAALMKALLVARANPDRWVLGADTIVVLGDQVLGKPADAEDAVRMLRELSGRGHDVYTGVALVNATPDGDAAIHGSFARTRVQFHELSEEQTSAYVATGEPMDKAGAYGIQGLGGKLVAGYDGSYTNVVGLPMENVAKLLAESGAGSTW